MITKESDVKVIHDASDIKESKFSYDLTELKKLLVNVLNRDTINATLDYSTPITKVTRVKNYNHNIFYFEKENHALKFIIIKNISIISDDKNFNGITFGFVDSDSKYSTDQPGIYLGFDGEYSYNYIYPNDKNNGRMSRDNNKEIEVILRDDEKVNPALLGYHSDVVAFMNNYQNNEDRAPDLDKYDKLVESFQKQYDIDPKMLLYVKTFKHGKLESDNDQPAIIWMNGKKEWYKEGKLHRDNWPAVQYISENRFEAWFQNGKLHREEDSAIIDNLIYVTQHEERWFNGLRHSEHYSAYYDSDTENESILIVYWQYGVLHRDGNEPAYTSVNNDEDDDDNNHQAKIEKWYQYGKLNRDNGPALVKITKDDEGSIDKEISEWYQKGKIHRKDGPAVTIREYDKNSLIAIIKTWYYKGEMHRSDGPAVTHEPSGEFDGKEYYYHGKGLETKKIY